jgi:hypothetical protein
MKTMDIMETATIGDRHQQVKSAKPTLPDFQANTIQIVSNIPEIGLTSLMGKAKIVHYFRKDIVGLEITRTNSNLVVFSGEVKVVCGDDRKHKEAKFHVQESQFGIGKIALLPEEMWATSIITLEKAVFAVILKRDFKNWMVDYPNLKFVGSKSFLKGDF